MQVLLTLAACTHARCMLTEPLEPPTAQALDMLSDEIVMLVALSQRNWGCGEANLRCDAAAWCLIKTALGDHVHSDRERQQLLWAEAERRAFADASGGSPAGGGGGRRPGGRGVATAAAGGRGAQSGLRRRAEDMRDLWSTLAWTKAPGGRLRNGLRYKEEHRR